MQIDTDVKKDRAVDRQDFKAVIPVGYGEKYVSTPDRIRPDDG
jgi:hypothetical protein